MKKEDFKIIFMGTPDFAVASLRELKENGFNIITVVSSQDKPTGRGQKIKESAVKKYAVVNNLKILQPENLKAKTFIEEIKLLKPDLMVVVAFRMLPESIWKIPKKGTINLHASLLPQYRGAAPINRVIINGEKETGVTTFFIEKEIDTGNIISQDKVSISDKMNAGELHDILMNKGAILLKNTVEAVINNSYKNIKQKDLILKDTELKNAPRIYKQDCKIDWHDDIGNIYNLIRGLNPYPAAWTEISNNKKQFTIKILNVEMIEGEHNSINAEILTDKKTYLYVTTNGGLISINELQLQGKKKMDISGFLNGFNLEGFKFIS